MNFQNDLFHKKWMFQIISCEKQHGKEDSVPVRPQGTWCQERQRSEEGQCLETGVVDQRYEGREANFWKLEAVLKTLLSLGLPESSLSADQSSARTPGHRFMSPKRSLKLFAFLQLWLSG